MKTIIILFTTITFTITLPAQPTWNAPFGAPGNEWAFNLLQTSDLNLYIGGFSCSMIGGDKTEISRGKNDYWVVKTNEDGNVIWDKTIGGSAGDLLMDMKAVGQNELLLGGSSESPADGDKTGPSNGSWDFWIVRISAEAEILWDGSYGGTDGDLLNKILPTSNSNYMLAGSSLSGISGDKTLPNFGGYDFWILKIDADGTVLWDKAYGGPGDDFLTDIIQTSDGGFLLAGWSTSEDIEGNYWLVKINADGTQEWEASFGGSQKELAVGALELPDGGYLVAGYSESEDDGNKEAPQIGGRDFWLVKVDASGAKIWDKTYGGTENEELNAFQPNCGDNFLMVGTTRSDAGNDITETSKGESDILAMMVDEDGELLWNGRFGGEREELGMAVIPYPDRIRMLGTTASNGGDLSVPSEGRTDYWLVEAEIPIDGECSLVHNILIEQGWNLISSYIGPHVPDMMQVLSPIEDEVILLKDSEGTVVVPSDSIYDIDNWAITKGYQLKSTIQTTLPLTGFIVDPPATPISIVEGWQIIAYLRNNSADIVEALASIEGAVIMVKNNAGQVYIPPPIDINTIGTLIPGQGYWLKSNTATTLTYTANLPEPPLNSLVESGSPDRQSLEHFTLDTPNTGHNATLVVYSAIVEGLLEPGDEIGVFSPNGQLCGAGVFAGENLAITVWGDDPSTSDIAEGLLEGELFSLRVWKSGSAQEWAAAVAFDQAEAIYHTNAIFFLSEISLLAGTKETDVIKWFRYFPNPAEGLLHMEFQLKAASPVRIELVSAIGKQVVTFLDESLSEGTHHLQQNVSRLSNGLYLLDVKTETGRRLFRLVIHQL